MGARLGVEELKELGAGRAASEDVAALHLAFRDFGAPSLWSRTPGAHPTFAQALVISESLRRDGNMKTRPRAVQIEGACRAALEDSD